MLGLGIVIFGLTGQFMVVEIMAEMNDVASFPTVYNCLAAPFQAVAYLGVGLGGCAWRASLPCFCPVPRAHTFVCCEHFPGLQFAHKSDCDIRLFQRQRSDRHAQ